MARKIQVPAVGGIRKVIRPGSSTGTTIAGYEGQVLGLGDLQAALGITTLIQLVANLKGGGGAAASAASLILGPGLAGGGALVGPVGLRLSAPIPMLALGEEGSDGEPGPPGQAGAPGPAGPTGPTGPSGGPPGPAGPPVFLAAQPGEDGEPGPPGRQGLDGAAGPSGASGLPGPAIVLYVADGEDGEPGPPGLRGAAGATGARGGSAPGAGWFASSGAVVVALAADVVRLVNQPCTIKECAILTDGSTGSCEVDVWKAALSTHFPPVVGDSIVGSNYPAIAGGSSFSDSVLTGWATGLNADDVLLFHLRSSSTFANVQIQLRVE